MAKLTSIHSAFATRLCLALLPCLLLLSATQGASGQASATEPQTFTYRTVGTHELKAYVFLPAKTDKARPAILLFHGGAWQLGDATWMFGRAKEFAANGIVAIAIDYRLANDGLTPIESVEDATEAFTWARSQANKFGIDTQRVSRLRSLRRRPSRRRCCNPPRRQRQAAHQHLPPQRNAALLPRPRHGERSLLHPHHARQSRPSPLLSFSVHHPRPAPNPHHPGRKRHHRLC